MQRVGIEVWQRWPVVGCIGCKLLVLTAVLGTLRLLCLLSLLSFLEGLLATLGRIHACSRLLAGITARCTGRPVRPCAFGKNIIRPNNPIRHGLRLRTRRRWRWGWRRWRRSLLRRWLLHQWWLSRWWHGRGNSPLLGHSRRQRQLSKLQLAEIKVLSGNANNATMLRLKPLWANRKDQEKHKMRQN